MKQLTGLLEITIGDRRFKVSASAKELDRWPATAKEWPEEPLLVHSADSLSEPELRSASDDSRYIFDRIILPIHAMNDLNFM